MILRFYIFNIFIFVILIILFISCFSCSHWYFFQYLSFYIKFLHQTWVNLVWINKNAQDTFHSYAKHCGHRLEVLLSCVWALKHFPSDVIDTSPIMADDLSRISCSYERLFFMGLKMLRTLSIGVLSLSQEVSACSITNKTRIIPFKVFGIFLLQAYY